MKTLDLYLAGSFFRAFLPTLGIFTLLIWVVTFFEKLRMFFKYDASWSDGASYLAIQLPWMITQAAPMSTLIGALAGLGMLSRTGEMTAIRAGGVSLLRVTRVFFLCGLAVTLFTVLLSESLGSAAKSYSREIEVVKIKKRSPASLLKTREIWLRNDDKVIYADRLDPERFTLSGVTIAELDNNRPVRFLSAREAKWTREGWVLSGVTETSTGGFNTRAGGGELEHLAYPLAGDPETFLILRNKPDDMSGSELLRAIEIGRTRGSETRSLEVAFWSRSSLPFACAVMAVLAVPFGVRPPRRSGLWAGVTLGLLIGFAYWLSLASGMSMAKAQTLPPWLGGWGPNIMFTLIALVMLRRAETAH